MSATEPSKQHVASGFDFPWLRQLCRLGSAPDITTMDKYPEHIAPVNRVIATFGAVNFRWGAP